VDAAGRDAPSSSTVFSRATLAGRTTLGASCVIPSAVVAEALGRSGLDWVMVDMQHGLMDMDAMVSMLQGLALSPVLSLVRVPGNDPAAIGRALDAGASGVIVPMVESAGEAKAAIEAVRYAPVGRRSWGPTRAAWMPSVATDPAEGLLFVMLETAEAFEQAEQILATPGVDGVWVGTSDLAVSLGLKPSDHLHPEVRERVVRLGGLCRDARMPAAIGAQNPEEATAWLEAGYNMLSLGRDLALLADRVAERLTAYRGVSDVEAGRR
jgi:4-hydroxy-2-oxoheptanedioate aldolase